MSEDSLVDTEVIPSLSTVAGARAWTDAWQSPPDAWSPGIVMDVDRDVVTLAADVELVRLRTHGAAVAWNHRYSTVHLGLGDGGTRAVFSVQPADKPPTSCEG